jgi:hypothetical protein
MVKQLHMIGRLLLASPLLTGCVTESESRPFHGDGALIQRAEVTQVWRARCSGEWVAFVRQYLLQTGNSHVVVQNRWGQDLGLVDSLGRAWRYRAHQEPAWVGSGTVLQGIGWILECGPIELVPGPH